MLSYVALQDAIRTDPSLILHWIPNTTIRSNPKSVDSPAASSTANSSLNSIPSLVEGKDTSDSSTVSDRTLVERLEEDRLDNPNICANHNNHNGAGVLDLSDTPSSDGQLESSTSSDGFSVIPDADSSSTSSDSDDDDDCVGASGQIQSQILSTNSTCSNHKRPLSLSISSTITYGTCALSDSTDKDDSSVSSGSTGGPDSDGSVSPSSVSSLSLMCDVISLISTSESIAESHNLLFPSSAIPAVHNGSDSIPAKPSVFSVNLGKSVVCY